MPRFMTVLLILLTLTGCVSKNIPADEAYLAPLPIQHINVDDIQVGYRAFGQGAPLLMIMGFAGTMDIWDAQLVRELAENHTVIIYDNRGIGSTSAGVKEISINGMADDAAKLLQSLGYEKAHVLGWSMGGLIAQELAISHPKMVDELILMGTACDNTAVADTTNRIMKMDTKELLSHFFPKGWLKRYPQAIEKLPRPAIQPTPGIITAQAKAMLEWPGNCERIKVITNDTLILSGTNDTILPQKLSFEMAEKIDGAWLMRFKNGTHWMMYQNPHSLARAINSFLELEETLFQ